MSESELEGQIDALFQLAPAEMVKARNALADALRKAGDKANAARVKALARPSAAAFALNRLQADRPELLEEALSQAQHVRDLHADPKLDASVLRKALAAQRATVSAIVAAGEGCLASADMPYGLAQQRKLLATVQGFLAGLGDEAPGRMTHDLEPGGFSGLQVVAGTLPRKLHPQANAAASAPAPAKGKSAERRDAERALERAEQRLRELEARQRAHEAEAHSAETELTLLTPRIELAEAALQKLREQYAHTQTKVQQRTVSLAQTLSDLAQAQEGVDEARRALSGGGATD